jgi:hypothetical protein
VLPFIHEAQSFLVPGGACIALILVATLVGVNVPLLLMSLT